MTGKRKEKTGNCKRQHVVPRFVVSGFTDSTNVLWVKTDDSVLVETGPGGKWFWDKIYSNKLDESWSGYEGCAATVVSSLKAGAKAVSQYQYWYYLMPLLAGTIARDRAMDAELETSEWSYRCVRLTSDQRRCLVFSLMIDALTVAKLTMLKTSTNRPFIMNDRGYVWSDEDHRMIMPITRTIALVAEWPDVTDDGMQPTVINMKSRWKPIPLTRPGVYYRDLNELTAMQAMSMIAGTPEDEVSRLVPTFDDTGILSWISSWLPDSGVWSWLDLMREVGLREVDGWENRGRPFKTGDLNDAEIGGMIDEVRALGPTWLPIWLFRPDRGSLLTNGLSMAGDNMIVDWSVQSQNHKWSWIPYKTV